MTSIHLNDAATMIHWKTEELDAALTALMIQTVMPQVAAAIAGGAAQLANRFEGTPFARYWSEELIIKQVTDFLTLSDSVELDRARPGMFSPEYYRDWFA